MNKLSLIAEKAKRDKRFKFTSLIHHINAESLVRCYKQLKKDKVCGIDGVTVEDYGNNLETNIENLIDRLKKKQYKPKPVRRTYIPKAGKQELRPLGIPSVEDKIVQMTLKEILEVIYEQDFKDCSYGFRPNRSCHKAIKQLNNVVMRKPTNYIIEVDIEKFFDTVSHEWLIKFLKVRIVDPSIIWLISKFLKAGIMEAGEYKETEEGTPQGGIISPLLANLYLHYVLDLWVEIAYKQSARAHVELIRYCDDFVVACESRQDADLFLIELEIRLTKFNLRISKEKTKSIKFGKQAWQQAKRKREKMESFNFLGFTHYCTASRNGYFCVRSKTAKQNLARKLKATKEWIKDVRNLVSLKDIWKTIKAKLTGHYNYFGVNGNFKCLQQYYNQTISIVFKWINRRSQKKSMNWNQFMKYLQWNPLPTPSIRCEIWNS